MDTVRYFLALLALLVYPPMVLFWLLIHPFTKFWRRAGLVASYGVSLLLMALLGLGLYRIREVILRVEYGANPLFIALAVILLSAGIAIEVQCRKQLSLSVLIGLPQLSFQWKGRLLTEGIYKRVRHPRYAGAALGLMSVTLVANYLASWVLAVVILFSLHWVSELEERELLERFGDEYREYRRRVPRFIPRWKW